MSDPLRIALVGVGRMGASHLRTLGAGEATEVAAVVDTRPDVSARAGSEVGARSLTSAADLVGAADVEAWLVATPTPTHPELVAMALESGVHVLCEKPLSLETEDHDRLEALAADRGLVLQVGFWRRFSPPWAAARSLIQRGRIGDPLFLRLAQWDADPPPPSFCDPAVSGGLAVDCGVHEYDLVEWLTDRSVVRVTARNLPIVEPAVGESGDVDNLVALLDVEGGGAATVDLTRNARFGDDVRTEILGSRGALLIDSLPAGRTRLATAEGIEIVPGSEAADATAAGLAAQVGAFASRVRGGDVEVPGAAASARALAIGRAVQQAAASGTTVPV